MRQQRSSDQAWVGPVVLEGRLVRLEPLAERHYDGLVAAGADTAIWRWMPEEADTPDRMRQWLAVGLSAAASGAQQPFATIEVSSGELVGSTRYLAIESDHRRVEIGATWLTATARGRGLNDDAKSLLLHHAFDVLGCQRVEFKTDARNARTRGALAGIGATFEGIARKHMISHGGRTRDSAWFSVVDDDWSSVRAHLEARLQRHIADVKAS